MHILYLGPISLKLLEHHLSNTENLVDGYSYPHGAYLVREYLKIGHKVTVVSTGRVKQLINWKGNNLNVYLVPQRGKYLFTLDFFKKERKLMLKCIREAKPDIIHANWTYEFAFVAINSEFPYLVTCRDAPWKIAKLTKNPYRYYRAFMSHFYVLPKIKYISFISPYIKEEVKKKTKLHAKCFLISNSISIDVKNLEHKKKNTYNNFPSFLSVSNSGKLKNIKALIKSFSIVKERFPNAILSLVGGNLNENGLIHNWAKKNKVDNGIIFKGIRKNSDILKYLNKETDIFVHPTLEESFSMVILEALSNGVPVIAGKNSGAIPWVLENGKSGLLVDVTNPTEIAKGIIELLENKEKYNAFVKNGYLRVKQFTMEEIIKEYINAFNNIIKSK